MRLPWSLLLVFTLACGLGLEEGSKRELISHHESRGGRDPVVRTRGQEVVRGGEWVKEGEFVFFDEHGREVGRGPYKDGREHGPWVQVRSGGAKEWGSFASGLREGRWTYAYPNGKVHEEGAYVEGERHGQWTRWYKDGTLAAELMYRKGELHGLCRYLNPDGTEDALRSGRYAEGSHVR